MYTGSGFFWLFWSFLLVIVLRHISIYLHQWTTWWLQLITMLTGLSCLFLGSSATHQRVHSDVRVRGFSTAISPKLNRFWWNSVESLCDSRRTREKYFGRGGAAGGMFFLSVSSLNVRRLPTIRFRRSWCQKIWYEGTSGPFWANVEILPLGGVIPQKHAFLPCF